MRGINCSGNYGYVISETTLESVGMWLNTYRLPNIHPTCIKLVIS